MKMETTKDKKDETGNTLLSKTVRQNEAKNEMELDEDGEQVTTYVCAMQHESGCNKKKWDVSAYDSETQMMSLHCNKCGKHYEIFVADYKKGGKYV
jgi:hypothetical protein